jgi:RNA polymerase sigma factor (sigma-70 family)
MIPSMIRSHPTASSDSIPTRRSLLERLKEWEDHAGWQEFFDTYWGLIYGVARRSGLNDAEAQDVVQETIVAVARNIGDFNYDPGRGSFKSWLLQQTRWRIQGLLRKKQYQCDGQQFPREQALDSSILEQQPAPGDFDLEETWDAEWERNLLHVALQNVRTLVPPRQYQLFSLHVLNDLPARLVAERVGVKLAEVYFAKYRVSNLLKKQVRRLEKLMT